MTSSTAGGSAAELRAWDFLVDRTDLRRTRLRAADAAPPLGEGEALIRVDAFALTSNNLTYALMGDRLGYWELFPASAPWGRIPAWGYGTVAQSNAADVAEGARFAGMVAMSTSFVVQPVANRVGFTDVAPRRGAVSPVYNRYATVPGADDANLERDAALRPVYILAFVLAQHLESVGWFGAERIVVTSASSKASLSLAHALGPVGGVSVTGLTSSGHLAFVRATGLYDDVATYDRVDDLPASAPTALIDISGDGAVRRAVEGRLGARLVGALRVGQTSWDQPADQQLGEGCGQAMFFAPAAIEELVAAWGTATFARRLDAGLAELAGASRTWLAPRHEEGGQGMAGAFAALTAGQVDASHFLVVRPNGHR